MGTRCHIGVRKGNKVDFIYCGHDGYVDGIGELLIDRFNSIENARKLIDLGNVSWVYDCSENEAEEYMEHYTKEWELVEVIPGVFACVKKGTKSYSIPTQKYVKFEKNQTIEDSIMIEYWYLFEDGLGWLVSKGGDVAKFVLVTEALKKPELVESRSRRGRMLKESNDSMDTYVFTVRGPVGTLEFYEDDLKSIIWEKDEDGCWVSYDPIPCVGEPIDTEVYVYEFRVCGNDLFVGGSRVKSIYSTNGWWKLIEDWKKLLDVPEDMEESFRRRGRMLKEERLDYTKTIPYTVRQYYNKYTTEWKPCIIYINSRDNGEWWIEWFDEDGTSEIGLDYGISRNGTSKCDPEDVKNLEYTFVSDCKEYGNTPAKKVSRLGSVGRLGKYIGR